jgi:exosome complex exonuclease DIS3/RRP44
MWISLLIPIPLLQMLLNILLAATLDIVKLPPVFQDGPQLTGIADSKNQMHD